MPHLTVFLVERYLPGVRPADIEELGRRLRAAAAELRGAGAPVEWLRSVALVEEESCLCSFRAATEADVREVNALAGVGYERIVPAHQAENAAPAVL